MKQDGDATEEEGGAQAWLTFLLAMAGDSSPAPRAPRQRRARRPAREAARAR